MSGELTEDEKIFLMIPRLGTDAEQALIRRGLLRMINLRLNAVPEDAANALRAIRARSEAR